MKPLILPLFLHAQYFLFLISRCRTSLCFPRNFKDFRTIKNKNRRKSQNPHQDCSYKGKVVVKYLYVSFDLYKDFLIYSVIRVYHLFICFVCVPETAYLFSPPYISFNIDNNRTILKAALLSFLA